MAWEALDDFKVFLRLVKTKDEALGWGNRPFPIDRKYAMWLADSLQYREERPAPVWIPKSRRLMLTWTMCAYIVWRGIRNGATHSFIQSNKLDDADFLLRERCGYIFERLPYWFKYVALGGNVECAYKEARMRLPNGALIWGFPQGADVARQFTASIIFVDEAALQPLFKEAVTAIMPLAEGKSELYFVSTAQPTYFGEICQSEPATEPEQPMRGIQTWDLKHGGTVWRMHHTADPDKDPETEAGAAWIEFEAKKFIGGLDGTDWAQEMNIQFGAKSGELVYPSYVDELGRADSSVVESFPLSLFERRFVSIDWGHRNPTCVLWLGELKGVWYIYREYHSPTGKVDAFKKMFWGRSVYMDEEKRVLKEEFVRVLIDPSADRMEHAASNSVFHLLRTGKNKMPVTKANRSDDGVSIIREWLMQGRLKVFSDCKRTRWEFSKYRYDDWSAGVEQKHNLKETILDVDNHAMDCLKYFGNLMRLQENRSSRTEVLDEHDDMIEKILAESSTKKRYYRYAQS